MAQIPPFLAEAQDADPMVWGVPRWVERDFHGYLRCGILAHGFARVRCSDCGHDQLLAISCKGRGVCPSCNAQRMAEVAAHLTDEVIPHLPVRQWVLSVPKRLRPFPHQTPELASAVLGIFLRALRSALRDASPGPPDAVRDAQLGAVSFPQRFGRSLNLVSNPRMLERSWSVPEAWTQVEEWLDLPVTWVPAPTERHRAIFRSLVPEVGRAGPVPDAPLAALAMEYGLVLCSTDRAFSRFTGLSWRNPLEDAGPSVR